MDRLLEQIQVQNQHGRDQLYEEIIENIDLLISVMIRIKAADAIPEDLTPMEFNIIAKSLFVVAHDANESSEERRKDQDGR